MGWSFNCHTGGFKEKLQELSYWGEPRTNAEGVTTTTTCIAKQFRGNPAFAGNFWTVWERTRTKDGKDVEPPKRFIVLFLLKCSGGCWGYKDIDEAMGPYEVNCPLKYLALAGEPQDETAKQWRQRVLAHHKNAGRKIRVGESYDLEPGCKVSWVTIQSVRPLLGIGEDGRRYKLKRNLLGPRRENGMKFQLGQLVMTPGAQRALTDSGQETSFFLQKHLAGDWGVVSDDDKQVNEEGVKNGGRILSAYHTLKGEKIWVITEWDRSVTTLLLPGDY